MTSLSALPAFAYTGDTLTAQQVGASIRCAARYPVYTPNRAEP